MKYIYTTTIDSVANYLTTTIKTHLIQDKTVLWLVSGGSAIATEVAVANALKDVDTTKLAVSLVDERYGPIGHADENWQQLIDAGFSLPAAQLYRPLTGATRGHTTDAFGQWVTQRMTDCDYSIGLFGIGSDGHTAGLKPGSLSLQATGWATDFDGLDYERITITFDTIKRLDEIVIQAMGADKAATIHTLLHEEIAVDIQPAQILKSIQQSTLFTDYKEI